jgi:DNA-directed RNA polymerase III subunit RPC4
MPASSRGSERSGRGTRSGRGARGRGASSQTASSGPSNEPIPTEASPEVNETSEAAAADPTATAIQESLSGRSTPAGSRSSQTPAAPSRAGSRFRPKNVRRDEAERKRLEEARNRDLLSKIKAEEREQRLEERRARRGRGRGGPPRGGLIRRTVTASGPFSAISSGISHIRAFFVGFEASCLSIY